MKRFLLIALVEVACGSPELTTGANADAWPQTPGDEPLIASEVKLIEPEAATLYGPRIWVGFSGSRVPQLAVTLAYDHGWRFVVSKEACPNDAQQVCGEIGIFPGEASATASIMLADTAYTLTGEGLKNPYEFRSCPVQQHLFYMLNGWLNKSLTCRKITGELVFESAFEVKKIESADPQLGLIHLSEGWTGHQLHVTRSGLLPADAGIDSLFRAVLDGQGETLICGHR